MAREDKLKDIKNNLYSKHFGPVGLDNEYEISFKCCYGFPEILVVDKQEDKGFFLTLGELVFLTNEAKKFFRDPTKGRKEWKYSLG